jgi:hypothetical protein
MVTDTQHKYHGSGFGPCNVCEESRVHANHKGYDYDVEKQQNIAEEAWDIVHNDREQAYDDPNVNFEKIALMWNGLFLRKLKPDARITPEEVALAFVLLKVSRESHKPQRDNRVDIIGYILCGDRIVQKREGTQP